MLMQVLFVITISMVIIVVMDGIELNKFWSVVCLFVFSLSSVLTVRVLVHMKSTSCGSA